jgi:hypothetical protein
VTILAVATASASRILSHIFIDIDALIYAIALNFNPESQIENLTLLDLC